MLSRPKCWKKAEGQCESAGEGAERGPPTVSFPSQKLHGDADKREGEMGRERKSARSAINKAVRTGKTLPAESRRFQRRYYCPRFSGLWDKKERKESLVESSYPLMLKMEVWKLFEAIT